MTLLTHIIAAFSLEPHWWRRSLNEQLNRVRLPVDRTELDSHNLTDLNQSTIFLDPTRSKNIYVNFLPIQSQFNDHE